MNHHQMNMQMNSQINNQQMSSNQLNQVLGNDDDGSPNGHHHTIVKEELDLSVDDLSASAASRSLTTPRKTVKISKEIDLILCDFVERHPALWNPQDKNYHKSDKREELFNELSYSVKLPGSNLKERWGAIRHTFTKNVRKVEFSRQGPNNEPLYKPSWPLFEKCLFLYEIVKRNLNKIKGNKIWFEANNSMQHSYLMDSSFNDDLNIKIEDSEPCSSSLQINTPEDSSSSYIPMTTSYDDEEMQQPPRKRRAREDSADNIQFLHPSDVMGNMTIDLTQDDCDTFGRLVVTKLKRMSESDFADAQIEILQVLKKYVSKTNNNNNI